MDHQQFILDNLKRILDVTDKSKAAELLKLVDEAGSTFIGGAGRSLLVSRFFWLFTLLHVRQSFQRAVPGLRRLSLLLW